MATTQTRPVGAPPQTGEGWLTYAGILVFLGGALNIIWGIAAIGSAHFFIANARYVIGNLNLWGWVTLIFGVVMLFAAFGIFNRRKWAVWIGIAVVSLNVITQLLSIAAYPWWSLALLSLDVLAMYGLIVYGARDAR